LADRKAVLVVDDDPGTLKGVKRLLREHGYDSVLFSSAEAFQNHDDFEHALCIVLDINLNQESGIEVRHRLKAAGKNGLNHVRDAAGIILLQTDDFDLQSGIGQFLIKLLEQFIERDETGHETPLDGFHSESLRTADGNPVRA